MIPQRFATEYPERCLELLKAFEPIALKRDLVGTFSIMLASSILIVPWERANNKHPLKQERGGQLQTNLRALEKKKWLSADFWPKGYIGDWRFARIIGDPNDSECWHNDKGTASFSEAANTIPDRTVGEVFRVLRNALAHGNIIYLDKNGVEASGARVQYLAFLSRYEETQEQREIADTYRLVTVKEAHFLPFVRAWAGWVSKHQGYDKDLRAA